MQKIDIDKLKVRQAQIEQLILRSFECELYLVQIRLDDGLYQFCDSSGKPISFRSQLGAKVPFKGLNITDTLLVHDSPYNEMIGLDADVVEPMAVKISNPDQDYS